MKSTLFILSIIITLNFNAINKFSSGIFANWNNPNTWTPVGVPTATDDVIINGAIIQNGNVQIRFLNINPGAGIINSGTISISGSLTNSGTYVDNNTTVFNGGSQALTGSAVTNFNNLVVNCSVGLSINSGARINNLLHLTSGTMNALSNFTLVNDGINNGRIGSVGTGNIFGNFTVEKWMTKCDGVWSEFGSCMDVSLQSLDLYYTGFPGASFYPSFTFINTYYYDETVTGSLLNGYYAPGSTSLNIPRGLGFAYWFQNFTSPSDFPRVMPMFGTLDFQTPFNFNVKYTNSGSPSDDGFNMLANPFPGTIDWDSPLGWTKTNIDDAIYVWDNCASLYTSHAGSVSINGGSRYISEGQAFWVQAVASSPNVICTSQIISSISQPLLKNSALIPNVAYIKLNGDEIAVRLDANGTNGVDTQFDAVKFYSDSSKIASCVTSNTTTTYAINTVFNAPIVTIPLLTKRSGILNFKNISSFNGYNVSLKDKNTNVTYVLSDNYNHIFTEIDTTFKNRFDLIFIDSNPTDINFYVNDNLKIYPNPADKTISILNDLDNYTICIINTLGQEVKKLYANENKIEINTKEFSEGIYFFNITSKKGTSINKILITH